MDRKKLPALFLAMLLTLGLLAGCSGEEAGDGGSFSSFAGGTLDGGTFTQEEIKAKDLTIINFWGMFCNPCRAEMPDLAAYAKALPDNVQLITICVDALNDPEETVEFLAGCGYEGVTIVTGDEALVSVVNGVQSFPTTIFVNSKGEVVGSTITGMQRDLAGTYTAAVNKALAAEGKAEISVDIQE